MRKICTIWLLFFFCSPERKNPYDPKSPYYKRTSEIQGYTFSLRGDRLESVFVFLKPESLGTFTNLNGFFSFKDLDMGDKTLFLKRKGFSPSSISIYLKEEERKIINLYMNALPQIETPRAYSVHLSRWWPIEDLYWAEFKVNVNDPDGFSDIDSVWMNINSLNFSCGLEYLPDSGFFYTKIEAESLPSGQLEEIIGKDIGFFAKDKHNGESQFYPVYIFRIIEEIPQPLSPVNDTVSPNPTFIWKKYRTVFEFTYSIEIYKLNSGYPVFLKNISGFLPDDTTYTLQDSLSAGDYFWRLIYVDTYGNRSISKPYVFYVK